MLRSVCFTVIGVIGLSATSLLADEGQKPKALDKAEIKKVEVGEKTPAKSKGVTKDGDKGEQKEAVKGDKVIKGEKPKDGETKSADKVPAKDGDKKPTKEGEKKTAKEVSVGVLGSTTEYYTTSPAQGQPADGKLKAGAKVRVLEKAGSYVRVVAQIEVFVPVDSIKGPQVEKKGAETKESIKKPVLDKDALLKKKAAAGKDKPDVGKEKAAPVKKGEK